jgi:L-alanine-DL-glutamate epimerase-like enolase superfamily enzyme
MPTDGGVAVPAACAARSRWTRRGLAEPIRIEDGWFTPPDQPGHGIAFDRATLAAHTADA